MEQSVIIDISNGFNNSGSGGIDISGSGKIFLSTEGKIGFGTNNPNNEIDIKVNLINKILNKLYAIKYFRFFLKKFCISQPMYKKIAEYKIIYPLSIIFKQKS